MSQFQAWAATDGRCGECHEAVSERKTVASLPDVLVVEASRVLDPADPIVLDPIKLGHPIALDPVLLRDANREQRYVARAAVHRAAVHHRIGGGRCHWWATTLTETGAIERVYYDDDATSFAESMFTRPDLVESWRLAFYVPLVSACFSALFSFFRGAGGKPTPQSTNGHADPHVPCATGD